MKKLSRKRFNRIFKLVPRITVDAIIESENGVLLVKRDIPPFKSYWHLCGETVQYGETLEQTLHRGVKEETGLKVKIKKYVGYYDKTGRDPRGPTISHAFLCEPIGGELRGSSEGRELKFFKKLPKKIGFDHRKILKDVGYR